MMDRLAGDELLYLSSWNEDLNEIVCLGHLFRLIVFANFKFDPKSELLTFALCFVAINQKTTEEEGEYETKQSNDEELSVRNLSCEVESRVDINVEREDLNQD